MIHTCKSSLLSFGAPLACVAILMAQPLLAQDKGSAAQDPKTTARLANESDRLSPRISVTPQTTTGQWCNQASSNPTEYYTNTWYVTSQITPSPMPPSTAIITGVYYQFSLSHLFSGQEVYLCDNARCVALQNDYFGTLWRPPLMGTKLSRTSPSIIT